MNAQRAIFNLAKNLVAGMKLTGRFLISLCDDKLDSKVKGWL
jgi:hypothetical protein